MQSLSLPSVPNAPLPDLYEGAKGALAKCARIDECKDWENKAQAMASYARQSQDTVLYDLAARIARRAVRRCGELLEEIESARGEHLTAKIRAGGGPSLGRYAAGEQAGMSRREIKNAVRIARIPADQFEALVESNPPPTKEALAELGMKRRSLNEQRPQEFLAATRLLGELARLRKETQLHPAHYVACGVDDFEIETAVIHATDVIVWLSEFQRILTGGKP